MPLKKGKKTAKKVAKSKRRQPQRGVTGSAEGAASWEERAKALTARGSQYYFGFGVEQSYKEAARYYQKAAEMGDDIAQFLLGSCYMFGEGVPQDNSEAARWLRLSSDQGNAEAQSFLGDLYIEGQGVPQDTKEGLRLLEFATANGGAGSLSLGHIYEEGIVVEKNLALAKQHFRRQLGRRYTLPPQESADLLVAARVQGRLDAIKRTCASCKKVGDGLKVCIRCKGPRYCGVACQKKDWPDHKRVCVERGAAANDHTANDG